ncbi:GNAT family N-acetyltransferase [Porticoccaceae bacterium]|jgi:TetR/AcrR family transcriptional repressor of bet genes|nr:GNAT family N-acetyltransferase [Porticoccaceae bacterium]MDC3199282.1 GNAT family N-acetyltransferase [Porticoccaceae bacterium]
MATTNPDNHQERRNLLIDATITAIAEFGLSKLTLAKISSIAGLTAGTVNFHFDSKESLLLETLNFVSEEFDRGIANALQSAGADPAKRLAAIIDASLDPEITEHRKMAVWHAFDSESRGREDYQRIRGNLDRQNFKLILNLCEQIISDAGKQSDISARAIANAISGITDEVWKEILFAGESYDRDDARQVCLSFLASIFPWCYSMPVHKDTQDQAVPSIEVARASAEDADMVALLFDQYRQFYEQNSNVALAKNYINERISTDTSVIFVARVDERPVGFTQLYSSYCSVDATPIWVLYDLYVQQDARRLGAGKALMNRALAHAKASGASRIDLETEIDNVNAQQLYESLGYIRDTVFYKYSLEV